MSRRPKKAGNGNKLIVDWLNSGANPLNKPSLPQERFSEVNTRCRVLNKITTKPPSKTAVLDVAGAMLYAGGATDNQVESILLSQKYTRDTIIRRLSGMRIYADLVHAIGRKGLLLFLSL